jgi:hypothetical protein
MPRRCRSSTSCLRSIERLAFLVRMDLDLSVPANREVALSPSRDFVQLRRIRSSPGLAHIMGGANPGESDHSCTDDIEFSCVSVQRFRSLRSLLPCRAGTAGVNDEVCRAPSLAAIVPIVARRCGSVRNGRSSLITMKLVRIRADRHASVLKGFVVVEDAQMRRPDTITDSIVKRTRMTAGYRAESNPVNTERREKRAAAALSCQALRYQMLQVSGLAWIAERLRVCTSQSGMMRPMPNCRLHELTAIARECRQQAPSRRGWERCRLKATPNTLSLSWR